MATEVELKEAESSHDKVRKIFTEIASDYDRVNRVISLGQIDRWRQRLVAEMELTEGLSILDLGCGTGKLTRLIADRVGEGKILGIDLTPDMIKIARRSLPPEYEDLVTFSVGAGENLDLKSNSFDLVASAFTLRNVHNLSKVIAEMRRVVKPGGKIYSLELAKPTISGFREVYSFYMDRILPLIGGAVQGDVQPYRYLAESVRRFPGRDKLKNIYEKAGFVKVEFQEILFGIAAIHQGKKKES